MMKRYIATVSIALLLLYAVASGQGFRDITAGELKKMSEGKKAVVIVDARTPEEFSQGHIPKAINIPPDRTGSISSLLPKNREASIIFYCRGIG